MRFRKLIFSWVLLAVVIPSVLYARGSSEVIERNRELKRTFNVTASSSLEINNKFGSVQVKNWDQDKIEINVHVKVKATKEEDVERIMSLIDFEFLNKSGFIVCSTLWAENSSLNKVINVGMKKIFKGNQEVTIDYVVNCPATLDLEIENRFGDIFLDNYQGRLTLDLSHGELRARELTNLKSLDLKYGNAEINHIKKGKILSSYSTIEIETADDLILDSKGSNITIENNRQLDLTSKHDKLFIENAKKLTGNAYFTSFRLGKLSDAMNLNAKYGQTTINQVDGGFSQLNLNGSSTDYYVYFDHSSSLSFVIGTEAGRDFVFPSSHTKINRDEVVDKVRWIEGKMGDQPGRSKVNINVKLSYVQFSYVQ